MPPSSLGFHKSYSTDSPLLTSTLLPQYGHLPTSFTSIDTYSHNPPYKVKSIISRSRQLRDPDPPSQLPTDCYKELLKGSQTQTTCLSSKPFSFHSSQTHSLALSTTASQSHSTQKPQLTTSILLFSSPLYLRTISQNILILLDLKYHLTRITHCNLSTSLKNNISQDAPTAPLDTQLY